jgi:RAT1-interacting protein
LDDSSIRYYYPPTLGAELSKGFDTFDQLDDTADDHLDSLLKTIMALEQKDGKPVEADIITWRGMMTKVSLVVTSNRNKVLTTSSSWQLSSVIEMGTTPYSEDSPITDICSFEINATLFQVGSPSPRRLYRLS